MTDSPLRPVMGSNEIDYLDPASRGACVPHFVHQPLPWFRDRAQTLSVIPRRAPARLGRNPETTVGPEGVSCLQHLYTKR